MKEQDEPAIYLDQENYDKVKRAMSNMVLLVKQEFNDYRQDQELRGERFNPSIAFQIVAIEALSTMSQIHVDHRKSPKS